jgi:ankyrin repeat protein
VRNKGNAEVVRALISGNADLNARTLYGNTPLHLAVSIPKSPP